MYCRIISPKSAYKASIGENNLSNWILFKQVKYNNFGNVQTFLYIHLFTHQYSVLQKANGELPETIDGYSSLHLYSRCSVATKAADDPRQTVT